MIEKIKTLIRPFCTVVLLLSYIIALFVGVPTGELMILNCISLGFWFGERAIKNGIEFYAKKKE